jgi:hypothetical protein
MSQHESTDRYIAAREAGDQETADGVVAEVTDRYVTGATDGTEHAELYYATLGLPLPADYGR